MGEEKAKPAWPVQQLVILALCRLSEPVGLTSVNPYLPEMVESFGVSEVYVAKWAGLIAAVFSLTQGFVTFSWQSFADRIGRKHSIMISLACAMVSTVLFGFSKGIAMAIITRGFLGAASGSLGIMRTMVAELVTHRSMQARAFTILPLVWCVGTVVGPILGGALAFPAQKFPALFADSTFHKEYPFALANIVCAIIFFAGILGAFLFLSETLETLKHRRDYGIILGDYIFSLCRRRKYTRMDKSMNHSSSGKSASVKAQARPSYREVFTFQSTLNVVYYTLLSLHVTTFNQLIPVFLHLPEQDHSEANPDVVLPFKFAGGFGIDSGRIGLILTISGVATTAIQFSIFPIVARRYGMVNCLRTCTFIYPFLYFVTPFTLLLPTPALRQVAITVVVAISGIIGVFAWPAALVVLTNSARNIPILGVLNAAVASGGALAKALGPGGSGAIFSWSIEKGYVIITWWILAGIAIPNYLVTLWLVEMDGPSTDTASTVASTASGVGSEVEEELALLTAVDAADDPRHASTSMRPRSPTSSLSSGDDEEQTVGLLGRKVNATTETTHASQPWRGIDRVDFGADFLDKDHLIHHAEPLADGVQVSRSRQASVASSTGRSASFDGGVNARNIGARVGNSATSREQ